MLSDLLSWDMSPKELFGQFEWLQDEVERRRQDKSLLSYLTDACSAASAQDEQL